MIIRCLFKLRHTNGTKNHTKTEKQLYRLIRWIFGIKCTEVKIKIKKIQ